MPVQSLDQDKELADYFTDVEELQELFKQYVSEKTLAKRIFVIHGIGGVGKSSLLRMFRRYARSHRVPVGLASADDAKSALDLLVRWDNDIHAGGVILPTFSRAFKRYRALLAKPIEQGKKAHSTHDRRGGFASKFASKSVEVASGALAGAALGSFIPGIGSEIGAAAGGVIGEMSADALLDWLHAQGFSTTDIEFLHDPAKLLTEDFLKDLALASTQRRIVLILDAFEKMGILKEWASYFAQRLASNVLFVVAGREVTGLEWPGYLAMADDHILEPMQAHNVRKLVENYHRKMVGSEANSKHINEIVSFAAGLPIAVTTAVSLSVYYHAKSFEEVQIKGFDEVIKQLIGQVPPRTMTALEAASVVRYFNRDILRDVMNQPNVHAIYTELTALPFVFPQKEHFRMHDSFRDLIQARLQRHEPSRYRELHERAANHFELRLEKATGDKADHLALERLYHRVRIDEEDGIRLFQGMAEVLTRYRLIDKLRALLKEAGAYPLERENSKLWREYYDARLEHLEARWPDAMVVYEQIGQNERAEPKLKAYALCDWGEVLQYRELRHQTGVLEKSIHTSDMSLKTGVELDRKLILNYKTQSDVYMSIGNWDKAFSLLDTIVQFYRKLGDNYSEANVHGFIKTLSAVYGDWQKMYSARSKGLALLSDKYKQSSLYAALNASWSPAYVFCGRYAEAEQMTREGLALARRVGEVDVLGYLRDLALSLAVQGKFQEAHSYFQECEALSLALDRPDLERTTTLRWKAVAWLKEGNTNLASTTLREAIPIVEKTNYMSAIGEILTWSGLVHETMNEFDAATTQYVRSLSFRGRRYFECGALTGLIRVKREQGDYHTIPPLLAEAEQLAQQHEYNDHLASLRLTQGQLAWEGNAPSWDNGFDAALAFYQHALIYAFRYNRFLLDEVLKGRQNCTPLNSIIPYCTSRSRDGKMMLTELRDWWVKGYNDVGKSRDNTISPIREGAPLLEAEGIARDCEQGDGSVQRYVRDQIESALSQ